MVVSSGDTTMEPFAATSPISGSIVTVSASVEDQVKVTDWPITISLVSVCKVTVGEGYMTFTVFSAVTVPLGPVAVMI